MKRVFGFAMAAVLAAFLAGYGTARVEAKVEYTKKEGKGCTTCHVKSGDKELNDTGKCYAKNDHSLKACKVPDKKEGSK
jgi:hypothetical protein